MTKFDFDDMNLIPKLGIVDSRSKCSTNVQLGKHNFKSPIIPANMSSVMNEDLAIKLASEGYFYIMHRFNIDTVAFAKKMRLKKLIVSISIGVNDDSINVLRTLSTLKLEPDFITIDIAHGHCVRMGFIIKYIRSMFDNTFIIAGNVSTSDGVKYLENNGANAVKVGIAPGSACFIDGTKVLTKEGYKNIEKITTNDMVVTHDGTYQEVINTISYITDEKLLKINNEICTEDHEFYIVNILDLEKITDDNYLDFCYFEKAKNIDTLKHKIISII